MSMAPHGSAERGRYDTGIDALRMRAAGGAPEAITMKFAIAVLSLMVAAVATAGDDHAHDHHHGTGAPGAGDPVVAVSGPDAPAVSLAVGPAPQGGLEARIQTRNFALSEAHADGDHRPGEGHAHLYLDGEKIARVFGERHGLPPLAPGNHRVEVVLYSNNHARYEVDGVPVAARTVVRVGRADTGASVAKAVQHRIRIRRGTAEPASLRVTQGERLQLAWDSDAPASLHLHGYDIEADLTPGVPLNMLFTADIGGRFPVAAHGDGGEGGHGHRALLYLEVYPD